MISAWHLLWIIPVCSSFSIVVLALMTAASNADDMSEACARCEYRRGK